MLLLFSTHQRIICLDNAATRVGLERSVVVQELVLLEEALLETTAFFSEEK